jgi:hypothetical protein
MSASLNQSILDMLRLVTPAQIAAEIISVQPMDEAGRALAELDAILKANPDKQFVLTGKKPE